MPDHNPFAGFTDLELVWLTELMADSMKEKVEKEELAVLRLRSFEEPVPYRLSKPENIGGNRAESLKSHEESLARYRRYHMALLELHQTLSDAHTEKEGAALGAFFAERMRGKR